jgi:hypothetical protein
MRFPWFTQEEQDRRLMRAAENQQRLLTGRKWRATRVLSNGRVELVPDE